MWVSATVRYYKVCLKIYHQESKAGVVDEDEPPSASKTAKLDALRLADLFRESQDDK